MKTVTIDVDHTQKKSSPDENKLEPSAFFTSVPLYQTAKFGSESDGAVLEVVNFNGTIEFYCPKCQKSLVFISAVAEMWRRAVPFGATGSSSRPKPRVESGIHTTEFYCSQHHKHTIRFLFLVEKDDALTEIRLTKIGQYPSLADLTAGDLKKYRKILSSEDFSEFNRAIGLATHGVGIGSFVYLRRIFERLVEEAHQVAKEEIGWHENDYLKGRMEEKIKILKAQLPSFLSGNWKIYSILSKGIHELSEEDCRAHFDVLKAGIELILDEKIEAREKQSKELKIQNAIQKIVESSSTDK